MMASAHTILMRRAGKTAKEHDNPFWVTDASGMFSLVVQGYAAFTPGRMVRLTGKGVLYVEKEVERLAKAGRGRRRAG